MFLFYLQLHGYSAIFNNKITSKTFMSNLSGRQKLISKMEYDGIELGGKRSSQKQFSRTLQQKIGSTLVQSINRDSYLKINQEESGNNTKGRKRSSNRKHFLNVTSSRHPKDIAMKSDMKRANSMTNVRSHSITIDQGRCQTFRNTAIAVRDKLVPTAVTRTNSQTGRSFLHANSFKPNNSLQLKKDISKENMAPQTPLRHSYSAILSANPKSCQPMIQSINQTPVKNNSYFIEQFPQRNESIRRIVNQNSQQCIVHPAYGHPHTTPFNPNTQRASLNLAQQPVKGVAAEQMKGRPHIESKLNKQTPRGMVINPFGMHNPQQRVTILSDAKLTLQGPPAYRVISKQQIISDHAGIKQMPIRFGNVKPGEKMKSNEPQKIMIPHQNASLQLSHSPYKELEAIQPEKKSEQSQKVKLTTLQGKTSQPQAQSLTASSFFKNIDQNQPTFRSNNFIVKLQVQMASIESERRQAESRISRRLDEITEKAASLSKRHEKTPPMSLEESRKVLVRHSQNIRPTIEVVTDKGQEKTKVMSSSGVKLTTKNKQNQGQPQTLALRDQILTRIFS